MTLITLLSALALPLTVVWGLAFLTAGKLFRCIQLGEIHRTQSLTQTQSSTIRKHLLRRCVPFTQTDLYCLWPLIIMGKGIMVQKLVLL